MVEARVRAHTLKQALKYCASLTRAVVIESDSYGFLISSRVGSRLKYSLRADTKWKGNNSPARSVFKVALLWQMAKEIPDGVEVTIELGNDHPLLMEWHVGQYIKTHFAVCPLVDKEDR
jgi:hypothetical protein